MNNKSLLRACLLAITGFACAPAIQAADDPAWYAGIGVGRTDVKKTSSWTQVTDATLLTNGITSSTLIDSHDTAWKLFGGYQFNENFAVEAGYHDLGRFKGVTAVTAPAASTVSGRWDVYGGSVAAVGIYPVFNRFSVFGKAGLALTRLKVDVPTTIPFSPSGTRVQPLLGVGVRFDATKAIGLRAEFERFNNVGDGDRTGQTPINVWSVSAQYRF
jgi:OOP family OmpA-OmpF porin